MRSFDEFFDEIEEPSRSLLVVNRSKPEPIAQMVEQTFNEQPIDVTERELPEADTDLLLLVDNDGNTDDQRVLASSPLSALEETILLVNSDLYKTGTAGIEDVELPDVLLGLDEVPFTLRGYPKSDNEKLLLIAISRYIERTAFKHGNGRLRTSFQRLSRIEDERGTREVYRSLGQSPVQTHVYGVPDWSPSEGSELITHGGYTEDFRRSWFVVYSPFRDQLRDPTETAAPDGGKSRTATDEPPHAALVALETGPRQWRGFWTFRPPLVRDIAKYISRNL